MKKPVFFFLLLFITQILYSQDYLITFSGSGEQTAVDSVEAENLTSGERVMLAGTETLVLRRVSTGITPLWADREFRIWPNPAPGSCRALYQSTFSGQALLELFDYAGRLVARSRLPLQQGMNFFALDGLGGGLYALRISIPGLSSVAKVLSFARASSAISIRSEGTQEAGFQASQTKSAASGPLLGYRDGELIRFDGRSGNCRTILVEAPAKSKTITFPFLKCIDADNNSYPVVRIGERFWMAANLKTTRYRNGDPIPEVPGDQAWNATRAGAYCNFNNSEVLPGKYGRLYNWYALTDSRSVAPEGWKLPTYQEAVALAQSLVGEKAVGGKLKETGTAHWLSP